MPENLIRISNGRPRLFTLNDRWGEDTNYWDVNHYGLVTPEFWAKLQAWQAPLNVQPVVGEPVGDYIARCKTAMEAVYEAMGCWTTLLQFDAIDPQDPDSCIRMVIPVGPCIDDHSWDFVEWSDADVAEADRLQVIALQRNLERPPCAAGEGTP